MQVATNTIKHVSQTLATVLGKPMPANSTLTKPRDVSHEGQTMQTEMIATLWHQLTDIYGARFVNQYGERDSGVWYQALHDLTNDDVAFGLHALLRDIRFETWPPNCTQFRHLCQSKPNLNQLPSVHQAFNEARENLLFSSPRSWSHPAVKFTVKYVGIQEVNAADKSRAFKAFSNAYTRVCERIAKGHLVPHVADEDVVIHKKKSQNPPRLSQLIRKSS